MRKKHRRDRARKKSRRVAQSLDSVFRNSSRHSTDTNVHHRRPKSIGGTSDSVNLSQVSRIEHQGWHKLFANKPPHEIARVINDVWLDPRFKFVVVAADEYREQHTSGDYECRICGMAFSSSVQAEACESSGMLAPRFRRGEKIMFSDEGGKPIIGTLVGWDREGALSAHGAETYTVQYGSGTTKLPSSSIIGKVLSKHHVRSVGGKITMSRRRLLDIAKYHGWL